MQKNNLHFSFLPVSIFKVGRNMKKQILSLLFTFILCTFSFSSAKAFYFCENGSCSSVGKGSSLKPLFPKIYALFKARNARIDFCEADSKKHSCLSDGLSWYASSPLITAFFSIPVARTLPQQNTLLIDYLVKANEYLPSCGYAISTFDEAENQTIRLTSHNFSCHITDFGKTHLQNTFFIDYMDLDNRILGGKYLIQTSGAITGNSAGYALMKFRDGQTLLPLVVEPYYGEMPKVPSAADMARLARQIPDSPNAQVAGMSPDAPHPLLEGLDDWWGDLKDTVNLDKPAPVVVQEDDSWWVRFTDGLKKLIYLEPLD